MHRRRFSALTLLIVLSAAGYLWRPHSKPQKQLVDSRLTALSEPYRKVQSSYFSDGGSIGIAIEDANGIKAEFALPNTMVGREDYQKVYVGGVQVHYEKAVEVEHSPETKQELIAILASHSSDRSNAASLATLSGRLSDFARATLNQLMSSSDE